MSCQRSRVLSISVIFGVVSYLLFHRTIVVRSFVTNSTFSLKKRSALLKDSASLGVLISSITLRSPTPLAFATCTGARLFRTDRTLNPLTLKSFLACLLIRGSTLHHKTQKQRFLFRSRPLHLYDLALVISIKPYYKHSLGASLAVYYQLVAFIIRLNRRFGSISRKHKP